MKAKFFFNGLLALAFAFMGVAMLTLLPPSGAQGQSNNKAAAPVVVDTTLPDAAADAEPPVVVDNPQPDDPIEVVIDAMMVKWTLYVGGIVNLLVLLSGLFPKFTLFADDRKRDLLAKTLGAVIVAAVAVFTVGPGQIWPVLFGFALAVFNYKNIIKIVAKTKSSAQPKVAAA